jgi:hypothetical protein
MGLTTFAHVLQFISEVTHDQIGRCHRLIGESGDYYAVENERGDVDPDGEIIQYCVRYNGKTGWSCTCPSGAAGFWNVHHPSGVCKHCRWVAAAVIEERGFLADQAAAQERQREEAEQQAQEEQRPAWYDPRNETSYFDGTRANLLIVGKLEADDRTYARVVNASPVEVDEEALRQMWREQERRQRQQAEMWLWLRQQRERGE